ncbi:Tn3 family transposase [Saccharopolyspora sp. NPDC050642]|uniref:Tn3 family transposase n=1 Tax=Saccharopolyspora sp. NPDC050642 TaxID=3157099 RepID=UPI0033F019DE
MARRGSRTLHLLQSALVHVNTLLLQAVLEVPRFHDLIGPDERRALTPLFWTHINPYGRMSTRLDLAGAPAAGRRCCSARRKDIRAPARATQLVARPVSRRITHRHALPAPEQLLPISHCGGQ